MNSIIPFEKLPPEVKESTRDFVSFRRELAKESDRGCALLAAAHLDFMLGKLLEKKLIGNKKHKDQLFGVYGPVGSFSAKILLSYSIGLISADALHDVQLIRKIRNKFGHSPSIFDFELADIKSECNKLKLNVQSESSEARTKFLNVVSALSGQFEVAALTASPFDEPKRFDLIQRKKTFESFMELIQKAIKNKEI